MIDKRTNKSEKPVYLCFLNVRAQKISSQQWDKYISDLECDEHGWQDKAHKTIKDLNSQRMTH